MKLKIDPTIYNNDRTRRESLKKVRKPVHDSPLTKARKKLFKVKRINNSDLYGDEETRGEHLVLPVAINPNNNDVATTTISSIEDAEGNPTKQEKIKNGLIMPIPEDKTKNFTRKVGIQQDVISKNARTGKNLNYSMLKEPLYGAEISEDMKDDVNSFLFENPQHKRNSYRNHHKVKNYVKIKWAFALDPCSSALTSNKIP